MKRPLLLVLAVLLAGVLALTNPTEERFAEAYAGRVQTELLRELELDGTIGNVLSGFARPALESALADGVRRDDLFVASVYTLPLTGEDLRALGILGRFVTLSGG